MKTQQFCEEQIEYSEENNLTHVKDSSLSFAKIIDNLKEAVIKKSDLSYVSVERQLEIIDQLSDFPFGRFLIERRGANGFWTDYLISHPQKGKISGLNIEGKPFNSVENFLLNQCPVVLAHQERFQIYQRIIHKKLKNNMRLASIPCGLMRDLLTLDFSNFANIELIGIDIDQESLNLASNFAKDLNVNNVKFSQKDAWQISFKEELDLITSSGLNVYESDRQRVLDLYKMFFDSLKQQGCLVISVLTYPPDERNISDWKLEGFSQETLLMDRILHRDILDIKWRNFRSIQEINIDFKSVGFSNIEVYFDKHHIFPTICAQK